MGAEWWCEAYGPPPEEDGSVWTDDAGWPRCFLSPDPALRRCASAQVCAEAMAAERQRVFGVIQEGAADGDPTMRLLAGEFPTPGTLLGGDSTGDR